MINYSSAIKKQFNITSASDPVLLLLEINHPDLTTPVRVVNNTEDVVHLGNTFTATAFELIPPDDLAQGDPRAQLSIDNVGRILTDWIEASGGGDGATVRIIQILLSAPDAIEWDITMNLSNVGMDMFKITGTLKFDDYLDQPGVTLTYRPDTAPGVF